MLRLPIPRLAGALLVAALALPAAATAQERFFPNVVSEVRDLPLTAEEMARYEGTYTLALGERTLNVRVFVGGGQLRVQPDGQGISRLMYQGDDAFIVAADRGIRIVFALENGRAETLTLHQSGQTISGPRQP